jgi:hypothetical protein
MKNKLKKVAYRTPNIYDAIYYETLAKRAIKAKREHKNE